MPPIGTDSNGLNRTSDIAALAEKKFADEHDNPKRGFDLSAKLSTLEIGSKAPTLCACKASKPWQPRLSPMA